MKKILLSLCIAICSFNSFSQLTYIPDDTFEALVEFTPSANNGITNDNYVLTAGLQTMYFLSFPAGILVNDLTGLQDFLNLSILEFEGQNITSIDLSNVPLGIGFGGATSNLLISNCPFLTTIIMPHSNIGFSIGSCPYLTNIVFQNDNILNGLNQIGDCNSLTTFDISNTSDITLGSELEIGGNLQLNCVNLKNGVCNKWASVDIAYNPALFCVEVDNPTFCLNAELIMTWQWLAWEIDPSLCQYSTNCVCVAGIDEEITDEVSISPNPTTDKITITTALDKIGYTYTILDNVGKSVFTSKVESLETVIDLQDLLPGLYFFKLENTREILKIIKQ